jgi:hypothetical protein
LPANYLKVTSGLGQGSSSPVLVVPVHNDGQFNGVVELGFLRALGPRDLEFVNMIANNIGNSIHAALYRRRLQDVLAESQQLNEDTFADHSLATDSVFSETQLVLCRNVLIYFTKKLQDRAFGLFHESLGNRGFLGLGSKGSIDFSAYAQRFEPLARAERIFRKRPVLPS